jgi:hypothetical protein
MPFLLLVCILSVVNAAGGPGALDPDQTEFIKTQIQHLSNMTKDGLKLSDDDLHDLMSLRLNVETAEDEGRDGLSEFPGSPTIIIQANGEVRIKDKEGTLLSQDSKFDDAMFDTVFGEYRKTFEEFLAKQEGLIKQIKLLQKQVERDQKGPITETFAEMEFTFYLNGTVVVSRNLCEPECFTDRAFFDGEIDDEIFNAIFPQDVLAKLTVEEANGSSLDTKADADSEPEPGAEPEPESESEPEPVVGAVVGSGAYKKFVSSTTVFFILAMFFN